jgi:predicted RNase H-like nuclease (RuvC/YqgF family)
MRNKSFSFEQGSSGGIKRAQFSSGKGLMKSTKMSQATNPFRLDESAEQDENEESRSDAPLKREEARIYEEMIERLRHECQEYELTIVEQDKELEALRQIVELSPSSSNRQHSTRAD